MSTGVLVRTLEGHTREVCSLDYSQDGQFIVSGSTDKTIRLWDMDLGHCHRTMPITDFSGEESDVMSLSVAFSPDDRYVIVGSFDSQIRIWDVSTGEVVKKLHGHEEIVHSVAATLDGKSVISGGLDKLLIHWDIGSTSWGEGLAPRVDVRKRILRGHSASLSYYIPVSSGRGDGVADPRSRSGCLLVFLGRQQDYVLSVHASHDNRWFASSSKDRTIRFWDTASATTRAVLAGHGHSSKCGVLLTPPPPS